MRVVSACRESSVRNARKDPSPKVSTAVASLQFFRCRRALQDDRPIREKLIREIIIVRIETLYRYPGSGSPGLFALSLRSFTKFLPLFLATSLTGESRRVLSEDSLSIASWRSGPHESRPYRVRIFNVRRDARGLTLPSPFSPSVRSLVRK